jgi:hypothetical protein
MPDSRDMQVAAGAAEAAREQRNAERFFKTRRKVYGVLLIFVVVVGLPIIGIPSLRNRLTLRVQTLKASFSGGTPPLAVNIGENREPFPAEYDRPAPPIAPEVPIPPQEKIETVSRPRTLHIPERAASESGKTTGIQKQSDAGFSSDTAGQSVEQPAPPADEGPKYMKGDMEMEAYSLLLKMNATVAGMVQGSNPSLRFKSWDALKREEDTYWVRLKFLSSEENADVEYIWQVKLQAKQVVPLSHNARALPQ